MLPSTKTTIERSKDLSVSGIPQESNASYSAHPLRSDIANNTLGKLSSRCSILEGIGQVGSRDNESTIADAIEKVTVDLGTTSVDVSERDSLERVTESESDLECYQQLESH